MKLKNHPYSEVFRLMTEQELGSLGESILESGLREPIVLFKGMILDGRNRYNKCIELNVEIKTREFEGTDLDAQKYVYDVNASRRHLNVGQLACHAAEYSELIKMSVKEKNLIAVGVRGGKIKDRPNSKEDPSLRGIEISARKFGIGVGSATKAKTLFNNDRPIFNKIKSGELGLDKAYSLYRLSGKYLARPQYISRVPQRVETVNCLELSKSIKIPECCAAPYEIFNFIDVMVNHGWMPEMKGKPYTNEMGEVKTRYFFNWYGNGFMSLGTCWTDCKGEHEFRRAVIVAAKEKLDKLKRSKQLKAA